MNPTHKTPSIAVVIPSYKVKTHILTVIAGLDNLISKIYVIDDKCPDRSGQHVIENCNDSRVQVIFHKKNKGVGGATVTGFKQAINDNMDIVVKMDGDNQMDPDFLPSLIEPITKGDADYTKGNRFFDLESLKIMPPVRLFGNAVLSFFTKISSGYWNLFDPTNGYIAISVPALRLLPLDKLNERYFFESDILFRLNCYNLLVADVPMPAKYEDEESNLFISKIIIPFAKGHLNNFLKRIFYNYYLRGFSIASIQLILGVSLFIFGVSFGFYHWVEGMTTQTPNMSGTVMIAALPIIIGTQFLMSFLNYDMSSMPKKAYSKFYFKNKFTN